MKRWFSKIWKTPTIMEQLEQPKKPKREIEEDPRCACGHPLSIHEDDCCMNPEFWQCSCERFIKR